MSEPYWAACGHEIYLGDCLDVLPSVTADAVVTDPPYGISDRPMVTERRRVGKRSAASNTWHEESKWDAAIDPAWGRAVGASAPLVAWFGQWRKREEVAAAIKWPLRAEIVWAKDCHVGPPAPLAPRDERIWIFSESGVVGSTFETSVWDSPIIPTWGRRRHRNEKTVALMVRLLRWLPAASIIDPFMGSGTTGVACARTGRRFIGIEQDPKTCASAVERMEDELAQGNLFPLPTTAEQLTLGAT